MRQFSSLAMFRSYKFCCLQCRRSLGIMNQKMITVSPNVKNFINTGKPVVALESTILTHGLPTGVNFNLAMEAEKICERWDVLPATVGVIDGKLTVGLSTEEIKFLCSGLEELKKVSKCDLPTVYSKKQSGGTTVSATLIGCGAAGINLFATGGLGGVHRGVADTWDISADLDEIACHPVAVVCSGVKSILDVPKTLEYLETKGVSVVSYQQENFPTFYSNSGKIKSPNSCYRLEDLVRALKFVKNSGISSGMVIANPVPNEAALDDVEIESIINEAMLEAGELSVKGKHFTPFILEKVRQKTEDRSLHANLALVYNNIKLACQISSLASKKHEKLFHIGKSCEIMEEDSRPITKKEPFPLIIGGVNIDISIKAQTQLSAASNLSRISLTLGGVGRNVAEVLNRLGTPPVFVSAVGNDHMGRFARGHFNFDHINVLASKTFPTSVYTAVLEEETSDLLYGFTQNEIHSSIDPETILRHETKFQSAKVVLLDANIHQNSARIVFELCRKYNKPLLFEPTDYIGCQKIGQMFLEFPSVCKFVTPNFKELFTLNETLISAKLCSQNIETKAINFDKCVQLDSRVTEEKCLKLAEEHSTELLKFVDIALISFGSMGVVVASRNFSRSDLETLSQSSQESSTKNDTNFFLFRAHKCDSIGSCSGAGDSFVGGFIHQHIFERKHLVDSILFGLKCAYSSLLTTEAVNENIKDIADNNHDL